MSYKTEANASQSAHANRIISSAGGGKHSAVHGEGGSVKPKGYKNGGSVGYDDGGMVEGGAPMDRLDRPARKGKGATTVNVIIAQKDPAPPAPVPLPMEPPMPAGPPPAPPMAGPGGPGGMPMPPMRKNGGRVNYDAGAGSAEGRLDKVRAYGAKAGKPAKSPKGD